MKRMLIVANGLEGGGAEKVLITLINHLDPSQYDITLYSMIACDQDRLFQSRSVRYFYFFEKSVPGDHWLRRFLKKLSNKLKLLIFENFPAHWFYRLFVSGQYDIEFAAIEGYATKVVSGSPNLTSRKIAWVHTDLLANHWTDIVFKRPEAEAQAYRRFDKIVCVSEQVKESVVSLFGATETAEVLSNPLDGDEIRQKSLEPFDMPSAVDGRIKIVSAGRLVEQKGYDRLLKIHKRLMEAGLKHDLWILGEGPQRSHLEGYIRQHHLEGSVRLLGFQANPYPYMKQCELFVCSSRAEGFSTAVTEALILGLPVVATRCAGMQELLGAFNEIGIMTENNDDALFEGIVSLLKDEKKRSLYKQHAKERAKAFELQSSIKAFEEVFLS